MTLGKIPDRTKHGLPRIYMVASFLEYSVYNKIYFVIIHKIEVGSKLILFFYHLMKVQWEIQQLHGGQGQFFIL